MATSRATSSTLLVLARVARPNWWQTIGCTPIRSSSHNQMAMLPKGGSGSDRFDAVDLSAVLEPAWSVGGDLYTYFVSTGEMLWFAVGDVSGKGVPAALFMVKANTLLCSVAGELADPDRILE